MDSGFDYIAAALLRQGGGTPWTIRAYVAFARVASAASAWWIDRFPAGIDDPALMLPGSRA